MDRTRISRRAQLHEVRGRMKKRKW
jgi:hypothetical protein